MTKSDAGVTGMTEQLSHLFPDGRWPEFPWKKGSRAIPVDVDVASPLFTLIPDWAGDWNDFAHYLRRSGYTPEDLHCVTVKNVSAVVAEQAQENMERRASRGLTISAGVGTCASTFTIFESLLRPHGSDSTNPRSIKAVTRSQNTAVKITCGLTDMRKAILVAMLACEATDKRETCRKEMIQDALRDMGHSVGQSFASHSKALRKAVLIDSQTSSPYGYWLTDAGVEVATYLRDDDPLLAVWYERWRGDETSVRSEAI